MKIKIYFLSLFFIAQTTVAQIGINTEIPQASVDINGDIHFNDELRVPSPEYPDGFAGNPGDVLTSQGPGLPPKWLAYDIDSIPGSTFNSYIISDIYNTEDRIGTTIYSDPTIISPIKKNDPLSDDWSIIEGLTTKITTKQDNCLILITLTTTAQLNYRASDSSSETWKNQYLNFVGGIFVKKTDGIPLLIAGRQDEIDIPLYPQTTHTIVHSIDDLPAGEYEITIGFQRLRSSSLFKSIPLHIGTSGDIPSSNSFMNKSTLIINIYEPV